MSPPHLVQHLARRELPHHERLARHERENALLRDRLAAKRGR